jgi:signal transduction histidine kinase
VLVQAPAPEPAHDPALLQALVRAVRHELDNPLSVVAAESQQLAREWIVQAEPTLERPVQAIHEAAQRLCDLATRLAAVERDPDALVITAQGGVALREPEDGGPADDAGSSAAESVDDAELAEAALAGAAS